MRENKHLTLNERNFIEQELAKNTSFREIAKHLSKDPTTISKEVRKHRLRKEGQAIHVNFNHCAKNIIVIEKIFATHVVQKNVGIATIVIVFALILLTGLVLD